MKARGSDGSQAPKVRDVSLGQLKGSERQAVVGNTTVEQQQTVIKQVRSRNN